MVVWYLTFLFYNLEPGWGEGNQNVAVFRIPTTSETACNTARTGLKFPPSSATNYGPSANVVIACIQGAVASIEKYAVPEQSTQ